uniref:NADH-ubiquinone oxidoreductase chain 6 n=1 Tax=Paragabara curvicornuta TaxID=1819811 RepID=A0A1W5KPW5_9NEOP|nr:NADH dehydrogenase subunit 6 [Paragabara curvicornuta]AMX21664.1 NADH dehydrogenase subunit 6 [Paragabara curvicornuta]
MTKLFLSTLIMIMSFMMLFLNNPLSMGLMILIQTMLISLLSGMMIKTYWFSYILFLIFMGGLLVLFIYVSSIASNELFKPSFNLKIMFFMFLLILFMMQYLFMNNIFWMNLNMNSDMDMINNLNLLFNNENKINLNKLYNNQTFMIMLMLVIYLFITLIVVVKITNIYFGPLRSKI